MKNHEAPLVECLRQRVQDSDFGLNKMTVRNRKGAKDRVTVLSQVVKGPLLEQLKRVAPSFTPWAWGVNGAFSVLAPVLAVAFSMSWGTSALLLAALPVYLLTAAVLPPSAAADAT